MATKPISRYADVIDSRYVIERIEDLQDKRDSGLSKKESEELDALLALQKVCEGNPDWYHGATLVSDFYFKQYAMELADDDMEVPLNELHWPYSCIDWNQAAEELRMDYLDVEYLGSTFWIRG